jgi:hypothetical protein
MEAANEEKTLVNTRTESKLVKNFRRIFGIVSALGFLFLIYKMFMNRFG